MGGPAARHMGGRRARAVGRPTLHGGPVRLRLVRTTLCLNLSWIYCVKFSVTGGCCRLTQVYAPSLLLSPSILSALSSEAAVDYDVSPDSGHRELSTDSLAASTFMQSDISWHSALAASTTYHHDLAGRLHNTMMSSQTCPIIASHHAAGAGLLASHDAAGAGLLQSSRSEMSRLEPASERCVTSETADHCGRVVKNTSVQSHHQLMLSADNKTSQSITDSSLSHDDSAQCFANEDSRLGGEDGRSFLDDSDILAHSGVDIQQQWSLTVDWVCTWLGNLKSLINKPFNQSTNQNKFKGVQISSGSTNDNKCNDESCSIKRGKKIGNKMKSRGLEDRLVQSLTRPDHRR